MTQKMSQPQWWKPEITTGAPATTATTITRHVFSVLTKQGSSPIPFVSSHASALPQTSLHQRWERRRERKAAQRCRSGFKIQTQLECWRLMTSGDTSAPDPVQCLSPISPPAVPAFLILSLYCHHRYDCCCCRYSQGYEMKCFRSTDMFFYTVTVQLEINECRLGDCFSSSPDESWTFDWDWVE